MSLVLARIRSKAQRSGRSPRSAHHAWSSHDRTRTRALKELAIENQSIVNASLQFDQVALAPTYRQSKEFPAAPTDLALRAVSPFLKKSSLRARRTSPDW